MSLIEQIERAQVRAGEDAVIAHLRKQDLGTDDLDKGDPNAKVEPPMATFIQPKITGYRQLGKVEADLMNQAKALGAAFEALVSALRDYHRAQQTAAVNDDTELQRLQDAEPARWLAMGRTDIQTGVMKIVRSIAQPAS